MQKVLPTNKVLVERRMRETNSRSQEGHELIANRSGLTGKKKQMEEVKSFKKEDSFRSKEEVLGRNHNQPQSIKGSTPDVVVRQIHDRKIQQ